MGSPLVFAIRLGVLLPSCPLAARLAAVDLPAKTAHTDGEDPVAPPTAPGNQLDQAWTRHAAGKQLWTAQAGRETLKPLRRTVLPALCRQPGRRSLRWYGRALLSSQARLTETAPAARDYDYSLQVVVRVHTTRSRFRVPSGENRVMSPKRSLEHRLIFCRNQHLERLPQPEEEAVALLLRLAVEGKAHVHAQEPHR